MTTPILANSLIEIFREGGPIMWPIGLVALMAIAVVVERIFWWTALATKRRPKVLEKVLMALEKGDIAKAQEISANSSDPVLRVVHAGLNHRHASLTGALQAAAGIEIKQAGRFLTAMDTIITLGPLLGLLGTVTGIMGSFTAIGGSELAVEKVTGGIGEALIATAFGLGIAILVLVPYNLFNSKVAALQHDIETAANNVEVFTAAPPTRVHV
ncbi:MotA/TolQ/ExbB proton channel family protein [Phragmitibacter flavus]|uniref:MotA/TolQ/ExbB proton channel family protein n=1 Tax=Phragmitibacter flavus TaxID=2576071 RepID=A0A5R8KFM8_9BACT|nr:MotA/TolQ/ExbB proton channel family protein [Phragmitibacter flavus]TLD71112.1 MotA/TolQ/ExbB proton channel family protein [Phragmitibacter flavus]